jgi:hypothetical protein
MSRLRRPRTIVPATIAAITAAAANHTHAGSPGDDPADEVPPTGRTVTTDV